MMRRAFLRVLSVSGALAVLPVDEAEALEEGAVWVLRPTSTG